jgi:hypothetical protein
MVLRKALFTILLIAILPSCKQDGFIAPLYEGKTPLASIRNLPIMSERECTFSLPEDTYAQIYAAGEANIDLVNVDPVYLYKPDAIEMYLKLKNGQNLSFQFPLLDSTGSEFTVNWLKGGVALASTFDAKLRLYKARITIPLSVIAYQETVLANIVLADNDDEKKQKAKLAWVGNKDPLLSQEAYYGTILLNKNNAFTDTANCLVSYALPAMKAIPVDSLPAVPISNLVFGKINKPEDFSAIMRSAWNQDSLFLYFTIFDNKDGRIDSKELKQLSMFHDRGWIEDEKGNVIWTMTNMAAQHAGGALKNRKIDTTILLKQGNYKLKYITDESHSWDYWDDEPPDLPFYGIEVYRMQVKPN